MERRVPGPQTAPDPHGDRRLRCPEEARPTSDRRLHHEPIAARGRDERAGRIVRRAIGVIRHAVAVRVGIAGVAAAVLVGVELVGIRQARAVVGPVGDAVAVDVRRRSGGRSS